MANKIFLAPYVGSKRQRKRAIQAILRDTSVRTICTVFRQIYLTTDQETIKELCLQGLWTAKGVDYQLRLYKKTYDSGWWENMASSIGLVKDTYKPKTFTASDLQEAEVIVKQEHNHVLLGVLCIMYVSITDLDTKGLCLEAVWMTSRMLNKLNQYVKLGNVS